MRALHLLIAIYRDWSLRRQFRARLHMIARSVDLAERMLRDLQGSRR